MTFSSFPPTHTLLTLTLALSHTHAHTLSTPSYFHASQPSTYPHHPDLLSAKTFLLLRFFSFCLFIPPPPSPPPFPPSLWLLNRFSTWLVASITVCLCCIYIYIYTYIYIYICVCVCVCVSEEGMEGVKVDGYRKGKTEADGEEGQSRVWIWDMWVNNLRLGKKRTQ